MEAHSLAPSTNNGLSRDMQRALKLRRVPACGKIIFGYVVESYVSACKAASLTRRHDLQPGRIWIQTGVSPPKSDTLYSHSAT